MIGNDQDGIGVWVFSDTVLKEQVVGIKAMRNRQLSPGSHTSHWSPQRRVNFTSHFKDAN